MSWSYSQVLVEEYLEANCLDTDAYAQLNTTPMPDQFYWPDKTTEHSRLSRFGTTCEPLTENLGAELLTWFLEVSRARTFPVQDQEQDCLEKDRDYGKKCGGLLAKYSPDTHSLKTAQCSLFEDLNESSVTLPRWGSMRNGELFQQPIPERHIKEKESGYWATPTTMDKLPPKSEDALMREATIARPGRSKPANLRDQVSNMHNWPTPTVCGNYNKKGASSTSGDGLATAVKNWPTPCASASKGSSQNALTRQDGKDRSNDRLDHAVMATDGGQLNPEWVEWLMGWPIGQTALKPLETGKFQEFMQQHGRY